LLFLKNNSNQQNKKLIKLNNITDNFIITKCDNDSQIHINDIELKPNCNYKIINTSNPNAEEATIIIYKDKNGIYHQIGKMIKSEILFIRKINNC